MTEQELLSLLDLGEALDWEFKSARGGLPGSLWETYSAMANTDGGCILLGIESDGTISGLGDPANIRKSFWDTVNNRGKVSLNLLREVGVQEKEIEGKKILIIRVPRADRRQRPIYIGQNPLTGTYRRNYEGDYHCSENEVGRMLADRSDEPADSRILEHFSLDDLDKVSLDQYRNRFASRSPDHPWLLKENQAFLEKLGGWRQDRTARKEGLTVAGLLMFGKDEVIRDPAAIPEFYLDYREKLSDDPKVRWTDRIIPDGRWTANLFQFYQRVILKLTEELKLPFQLGPDLYRKDDTIVHEAIREALVNSLIHADYRGQGGIVIEKYRDRIELSNPGTLLVSLDQILAGGVSECRNKSLQTMFLMIGGGEKAGSGIDKIRQGWRSQHWRVPGIVQTLQPDRVRLVLPMISLLPEQAVQRLQSRFGKRFQRFSEIEVQALVTAEVEGGVTNQRLREMTSEHPSDLTRMLQGLVAGGFLWPEGQKRWTVYRLPGRLAAADWSHKTAGTPIISKGGTPIITEEGTPIISRGTPFISGAEDSSRKGKISRVTPIDYRKRRVGDSIHSAGGTPIITKNGTPIITGGDSLHNEERLPSQRGGTPFITEGDSLHSESALSAEELDRLLLIAAPAKKKRRLKPELMRKLIIELCDERYWTAPELAEWLNRSADNLRQRFLMQLVAEGLLERRYPNEPNRPDQAYTKAKKPPGKKGTA